MSAGFPGSREKVNSVNEKFDFSEAGKSAPRNAPKIFADANEYH
jgi:hypothetical protein